MLRWRLMMEGMRVCYQTQRISKLTQLGLQTLLYATLCSPASVTLCPPLQQYPEEDHTFCHVLWISVSVWSDSCQ